MIILTDVDGVLLNWVDPFHEWMRRQGYICTDRSSYELDLCYKDVPSWKIRELVETFNASANMGFLPPLNDAVESVQELHRKFGIVFHCITSMGLDPFAQVLRKQNLKRLFGNNVIQRVKILGCGADKSEALKEYDGSGFFWLEDNIKNANDGYSFGLRSFLFNREYNKQKSPNENFLRIDNWEQIKHFIQLTKK